MRFGLTAYCAPVIFWSILAGGTVWARPGDLDSLYARYTCPIAERLRTIATDTSVGDEGRFIVVSVEGHPQSYVQCIFLDQDSTLLCETASGAYGPRENGEPVFRVSPERRILLENLGFDTKPGEGNYQQRIGNGSPLSYAGIAELILEALHDGYGAGTASAIDIYAPLAVTTDNCLLVG